jgi:hypothetical protein
MLNLRHHTANYEITLAILGAFGMMSMMLQPVMGKVIMGGALSLLFVLYFLDVLMPRDMEDDSRFQALINRINYLGAACSSVLLLLLFLPGSIYPAVISAGLMIICLALNAAHRYLYRIHDQEYYYRQLRLILLTGITVLVLVMGR